MWPVVYNTVGQSLDLCDLMHLCSGADYSSIWSFLSLAQETSLAPHSETIGSNFLCDMKSLWHTYQVDLPQSTPWTQIFKFHVNHLSFLFMYNTSLSLPGVLQSIPPNFNVSVCVHAQIYLHGILACFYQLSKIRRFYLSRFLHSHEMWVLSTWGPRY